MRTVKRLLVVLAAVLLLAPVLGQDRVAATRLRAPRVQNTGRYGNFWPLFKARQYLPAPPPTT
jgi:hypothetical protein